MAVQARAFWVASPGVGEIRSEQVRDPGPGEVLVRMLASGVSRGTETLVLRGRVPPSEHERMRAPFQVGDFPAPVKYGYLGVGVVEEGSDDLRGRRVFVLHPHQTAFVVPAAQVTPVPDDVPTRRAVLAGTVETAVTALWDAPPLLGDRVAVVGAGMVGCCVAALLGRVPGVRATLVDLDASRAAVAEALGVAFARREDAPRDCDLVIHASGTAAGLRTSLGLAADDSTVLDVSWHGDAEVPLPLGAAFHSRRLTLRSSQVGGLPPGRRARWGYPERRALALELLRDPVFEHLLTGESAFEDLPQVMTRLADGSLGGICHTIAYDREAR